MKREIKMPKTITNAWESQFKLEVEAVKSLGEKIGYGNMINIAAALWRQMLIDSGGSPLSTGHIVYWGADEEWVRIGMGEAERYDKLIKKALNNV